MCVKIHTWHSTMSEDKQRVSYGLHTQQCTYPRKKDRRVYMHTYLACLSHFNTHTFYQYMYALFSQHLELR